VLPLEVSRHIEHGTAFDIAHVLTALTARDALDMSKSGVRFHHLDDNGQEGLLAVVVEVEHPRSTIARRLSHADAGAEYGALAVIELPFAMSTVSCRMPTPPLTYGLNPPRPRAFAWICGSTSTVVSSVPIVPLVCACTRPTSAFRSQ
jgi:hypothetical protein